MSRRRFDLLVCLTLATVTAAVYAPVRRFGFVHFDDFNVVVDNPHVAPGLTAADVRWALTGFAVGHWEPLTWLSLQADESVWGGRPGPMHVENVVLHAVGSAVLYGMLAAATGVAGRSAAVAALFAVHPMHVESVAWITERRDVLSTPLLLGAVWAFVRYARSGRWVWYVGFLALYGLSLASKATGITLPAVLLLWDAWPLGRSRWRRLVAEQVLPAVMAVATAALAAAAQVAMGAASTLVQVPVGPRLANAIVTPLWYVAKLTWPTGLAAFYPFPPSRPAWQVIGAAGLLLALTAVAARQWRRRPFLLVGWGWFLIVLLPTSGIVQSGPQATADRYSYVPSIGLTVAAVWTVPASAAAGFGLAAVVVALAVAARRQVGFWVDTRTLQTRMMDVDGGAAAVHLWLGEAAVEAGDVAGAESNLREAMRLDPADPVAPFDLGNLRLRAEHDPAGAIDCYRRTPGPDRADRQANWGVALAQLGRPAEAYDHLRAAEQLDPSAFEPHLDLGTLLLAAGRRPAAAAEFADALRADPASAAARAGLARATEPGGR